MGITASKMERGEKINPNTNLPVFLNTRKASETGPKPSGKKFEHSLRERDESVEMIEFVRRALISLPAGIYSPKQVCDALNFAFKTQKAPGGFLCKASYIPESGGFYFSFSTNGKNIHASLGPIPEQEIFTIIPKS